MGLVGAPIPPKPATFTPEGAPPGVTPMLTALRGADGRAWWESRPIIRPRVAIVHTNAAEQEGSSQSQINWGNAAPANTKPHYAINQPTPMKLVPTNRRAIANSTEDWYEKEEDQTDASFWTIAIESADSGTKNDPQVSDFLTVSKHGPVPVPHAELVARILAYESIVWGFPLAPPAEWDGTGVAAHTHPFPHPAYTIQEGKTCPGPKKIRTLFDEILPRAREIRQAWTAPDQTQTPPPAPTISEVPDMILVRNAEPHQFTDGKTYPAGNIVWELVHGELRHVGPDEYAALTTLPITGAYTNAQLARIPRYSKQLTGTVTGTVKVG